MAGSSTPWDVFVTTKGTAFWMTQWYLTFVPVVLLGLAGLAVCFWSMKDGLTGLHAGSCAVGSGKGPADADIT